MASLEGIGNVLQSKHLARGKCPLPSSPESDPGLNASAVGKGTGVFNTPAPGSMSSRPRIRRSAQPLTVLFGEDTNG